MRVRLLRLTLIASVMLQVSCTGLQDDRSELYADRAVNLGWVAAAVQGAIDFGDPPEGLTNDEFVQYAVQENPELLTPLEDFYVSARKVGKFSSVLMCNKDRTRALAEDAGCTSAKLDARLWDSNPHAPCEFNLDLPAVCSDQ